MFSKSVVAIAATLCELAAAQTFSACNPLYSTGCPVNTALGRSISVDFTKGSVNSFTAVGDTTYDSNGVHFTVRKGGDAPQLASVFYIMFGRVQFTMKSAPGAGIVSSLVLQSDTLDEIDIEWLGADDTEMQTNYFGKGDVTSYNRGAFNPAPNNQGEFISYTIDWTAEQITWSVGDQVVRVLTPADADTNQYPQSPMQVKFGAWSGGDPANPAGTIDWSRGPTDYSQGPFTMSVRSIEVTDYSTGTQYKYGDTSGNWPSIEAVGGEVNGNIGAAGSPVASADIPAITSPSPQIPVGLGEDEDSAARQTGWPWVATTTLTTVAASSAPGIPSGWVITSEGKVVPASSAAVHSSSFNPILLSGPIALGLIAATRISGWETQVESFDGQGFFITAAPTPIATAVGAATQGACFGLNCETNGEVVGTSSSKAGGIMQQAPTWRGAAVLGVIAALERLLL
ncbi:hypothetical protein LZ554_000123 [Drepanopeziza brunnea f. sp. 'monogermtubi']|nr:hypothetical protein LZ554_000123 [Drepanopeziza brunnea f. sp. 'monogermtubi']